ncbi:MAG: methionyl-tRNA formyltransferase [Candidatus Zixiibacteriota bacterium]
MALKNKFPNLIFLGGDGFAAAIFERLIKDNIRPKAIFTYPPKERGRGRKPVANPVRKVADKYEIECLEFDNYKTDEVVDAIKSLNAKLGVVISFKILPEKVFNAPEHGMINLHPSLLPDLRGAAPLNWAIAKGYLKSGITVFFLDKKIDSGNILLQKEVEIGCNETYGDLWYKVQKPSAEILKKAINLIYSGDYKLQNQNSEKSSYAPRIKQSHLEIDWSKTASQLHNQIRAFAPKPGAFTFFKNKRVKLFESEVQNNEISSKNTGEIVDYDDEAVIVTTGKGFLKILMLQPENKRKMSGHDFWLGYVKEKGQSFG